MSKTKRKTRKVMAADLFCGAGGFSEGLVQACEEMGIELDLLAVNHWPVAIATHSKNIKIGRHVCESLDGADPRKLVPGGHLDLLLASPECTHFSNARGGKPKSEQSRASAMHVIRWCEALRVDSFIVENVQEFLSWGPLGHDGKPLKSRKGELFQAWYKMLEALGYKLDFRKLIAADFGDPTTRERLFIIGTRGRRRLKWPEPTHSKHGGKTLFGTTKKWRPAKDIIDWNNTGESIFTRKRPLKPKTIARIAAGIEKFSGVDLAPFLVKFYGTSKAASLSSPAPTVTAGGKKLGLCEPFLIGAGGPTRAGNPQSTRKPLGTVLTRSHRSLVTAFLLSQQSGGAPRSTADPVPTVATKGAISVVSMEPFILPKRGRYGKGNKARSIKRPVQTVVPHHGAGHLIQPILVATNHGEDGKTGRHASRTKSLKDPMPTVTAKNGWGVAETFLIEYYSNGKPRSINSPLGTVTGKPHHALIGIKIDGKTYALDIRFRMLTPRELARAQGFRDSYEFDGRVEDIVKQIGNAVPCGLAKHLCRAALEE